MPGGAKEGNNNARKGKVAADAIRTAVARVIEGDPEGRTYLAKAAHELACKAAEGDVQAFKEVIDRLDGKAHQSMSVKDESPLEDLDAGSLASIIPIIRALIARERESAGSDGNGVIH